VTADPLRQQLEYVLREPWAVTAIWPLIEAWGDARVAAARAETAEQIATLLESFEGMIGCVRAIDPVLIDLKVVAHNPVQGEMHKVIGYTAARFCAALARSVPETTPESLLEARQTLRDWGYSPVTDEDLDCRVPGTTEGQSDG
jgi:hypothetical protein